MLFIRECLFFEKVETLEAIICLALLVLLQDRLHYLNISYSDEGKYAFVNSVNFDTRQGRMVSFTNSPLGKEAREHQNPLNKRLAVPQGCYFSSIYIKFAVLNNVPYASFESQLSLFLYRV